MTIAQQTAVQELSAHETAGGPSAESAFAAELRGRMTEARTALQTAEAAGDPVLAQIAESDLADLRALAARNDVPTDEDQHHTA